LAAGNDRSAPDYREAGGLTYLRKLEEASTISMSKDKMFSKIRNEASAPDTQLSRYRALLYFVASRVLEDRQGAEEAVENCLLAATRNPPTFESEGAFRSWLLRILIDEALQILHQERSTSTNLLEPVCGD